MIELIKRKLWSSLGAAAFSSFIIPLTFRTVGADEYFITLMAVSIYVFLMVCSYGNIVSLLLELLLGKYKSRWITVINGCLHVALGALGILGVLGGSSLESGPFIIFGMLCAGIYFILDQILKGANRKGYVLISRGIVILIVLLVIIWIAVLTLMS